jgi:prepilin-type N-terminal cleavage/methylation domain-containing protein
MKRRHAHTPKRSPIGRAFTLIELIVVVSLLVVVLGIAVPAFNGMVNASERSLAENTLRVGVTVARDLAALNGEESGLLFVRDTNGRTRLIPVVKVGTLTDAGNNPFVVNGFNPQDPASVAIERDVFAPVDFASTLQMPRGWGVAGYAEAGSIDRVISDPMQMITDGWYDSLPYGDDGMNVTPPPGFDAVRDAGHWVLPETDLYEKFTQAPGASPADGFTSEVSNADANRTPRQSFMLRFESGTGLLVRGGRPALVLDPRPSSLGRLLSPTPRWTRANRMDDAVEWTNRVLETLVIDETATQYVPLRDESLRVTLIGNFSNDTVLAGTVARLAIFEDRELAAGLGASGLNAETNSLYAPISRDGRIQFDEELFTQAGLDVAGTVEGGIVQQGIALGITRWIQGDTNFLEVGSFASDADNDGSVYNDAEVPGANGAPADQPVAQVYFIHPGTGELTEVSR